MQSTVLQAPTVIVAPIALQQALLVLLRAQGVYAPILCAATVQGLAMTLAPRLLLYTMPEGADATDVQTLKQRWPAAGLLVLVAKPAQQALAQAAGVGLVPETKSAHLYPGIEAKLLAALEQAHYLNHAIIQSFEADSLKTLHQLAPQAQLCALSGWWQLTVEEPAGDAHYICPMAEMVLLNPYMVHQAHRAGRQVIVWFWLPESSFLMRLVQFWGADGLITDDPLKVRP